MTISSLYRSSRTWGGLAFALVSCFACGANDSGNAPQDASSDTDTGTDTGMSQLPDAAGIVPGPVDDIIAAMPAGSWKELPGTMMADVCPTPYSYYACENVMGAWSGGAYDSLRDRLIVWGGGHSDSPYNNVFTFDLASMTWKRWTELPATMTGTTTPAIFKDKRLETCGFYPKTATLTIPDEWLTASGYVKWDKCDEPALQAQLDLQQPRSAHSYGNIAFSQATGRFYLLGTVGPYPSGQASAQPVMGFDFTTSQWSVGPKNPGIYYGRSATDANGHIWYVGGAKLAEYDPQAGTWTMHPPDSAGYYGAGADIDTKRNLLALSIDGTTISTYALSDPAKTYAKITATGRNASLLSALAYSPVLDRFVTWSGGRELAILDLPSATWTTFAGTGDDPGAPAVNGTYGRFRYSPARNVFVVVNGTKSNVFLWKPPATAP